MCLAEVLHVIKGEDLCSVSPGVDVWEAVGFDLGLVASRLVRGLGSAGPWKCNQHPVLTGRHDEADQVRRQVILAIRYRHLQEPKAQDLPGRRRVI